MYYTTLNRIRECVASPRSLSKLLKLLGKTSVDDEPLPMSAILESNEIQDAIWCLLALDESADADIKLFAWVCANQASHLLRDKRSKDALDVAENFLNGLASKEELAKATDAAYAAYADAVAAYDAAYDAAYVNSEIVGDAYSAAVRAVKALHAAAKAAKAAADAADAASADTTSDAAIAAYTAYAATEAALASKGEALLSMREKFGEIFLQIEEQGDKKIACN